MHLFECMIYTSQNIVLRYEVQLLSIIIIQKVSLSIKYNIFHLKSITSIYTYNFSNKIEVYDIENKFVILLYQKTNVT